jgi:hypothetical protein
MTLLLILVAKGDPATAQVVRRYRDGDAITGNDANAKAAHLAGRGGQKAVPVVQVDAKHRARQDFGDDSFHLDSFLFHPRLACLRAARSRARRAAFDFNSRAALGFT